MITKEVNLCGKIVTIGYCYATEIAFKSYTDEECLSFIHETAELVKSNLMPDAKKSLYLILSAIVAYYESKGEESPVKDTDLMYNASPEEVAKALAQIILMWSEFYHLPKGEEAKKEEQAESEDDSKNA